MKRWPLLLALLVPLAASAQHAGEFDSSLAEHNLAGEKDKDGDRIQLNLKGVSATPTPAALNRCAIQCDAVADQLVASVNGGVFQVLASGGSGNGCDCSGSGASSAVVGVDAVGSATNSTAIGKSASATGASSTIVGYGSSSSVSSGTCVGALCTIAGINSSCVGKDCTLTGTETVQMGDAGGLPTTGTYGVCLGSSSVACSGAGPICIGQGSNCTNGGHCIGRGCSENSSNKLGIGSAAYPIQNVCVGHGCTTTTESVAGRFQASDIGSGTDKTAGPLQLRGGAGTGTGDGGNLLLQFCAPAGSTGSSTNSCATAWHVDGSTGELYADGHELHFSATYGIDFDGTGAFSLKYDGTNLAATGTTTVTNASGGAGKVALTGSETQDLSTVRAVRGDTIRGVSVEARQTGTTASSSTASVLNAIRETTLTGGAALSGPVIRGVDDSNTTGDLLSLERPANTYMYRITNTGEIYAAGISEDGTGKAVCVKSDKTLGTCSDAVGGGGTCTCG